MRGFMEEKYKEEFEDLMKIYESGINMNADKLSAMMPTFLNMMRVFIELHENGQRHSDKLRGLREKLGLNDEDEGE